MAQYPCSHCGQRYRGPQQTAYPSIVNGTSREGSKQRLCPDCLAQFDAWTQDRLVPSTVDEPQTLCIVCHAPDPELAVFCTIYRIGQDREDWYGRLHDVTCLSSARVALFGTSQAQEAA